MHAALAIFAALLRRERSGEGCYLDVAVADGVLSLMSLYLDQHLATGADPGPGHDILTGRYACYDTYRARDGRWLAVGAIEPHFYANLCRALGLEQWIPQQLDDASQDAIRRDFAAAFATRDRDDWVAELAPANTCVAPVNDIAEATADAQYAARGAFATAEHPSEGRFRQVGHVLAGMQPIEGPVAVRDGTVTDTSELLAAAGVPEEQLEAMRRDGVIA
jgi:alpha-methylacyl-CoA racemase